MIEIQRSETFTKWFEGLRDRIARKRIFARLDRLVQGLAGDTKPIGQGVSELRIDYGPGYRVYYLRRGNTLIILLAGGDKNTQSKDIQTALDLAKSMKETN